MPEHTDKSADAFQHLVRLLEDAVKARADAVGLEWDGQDLTVIHYFGSMGRTEALISKELEQAVIAEIVVRAGLADRFRGKMQVSLLGRDYEVLVDERDNFGESEFTLTLKRSGNRASQGGHAMSETQPPPMFRVGDLVRVKPGVMDVDYPDLPLGGWAATISEVRGEGMYCLRWTKETLESVHPVYRRRCQRDETDLEETCLWEAALEPDPGGPLTIEQPTRIVTPPLSLDDQDDRIRAVFGLTSDDPLPARNNDTERAYFTYLKANLAFPFAARYRDRIEGRTHDITVFGMADEFPIDEALGVMCEGREEEEGGQEGEVPLSELELGQDCPGFQLVDDYLFWFAHAPQYAAANTSDEQGDEEDEDQEMEDDEVEDDY